LLTFSAKHIDSLQQRIADLHGWLAKQSSETFSLEAIAYTLNAARVHFQQCRSAMVISSLEELQRHLRKLKKIKIHRII